jgi:tetratricopeptide (TPR) repeat protein
MTARIFVTLASVPLLSCSAVAQNGGEQLAAADRVAAENHLAAADRHFENGRWESAVAAYEQAKHHTPFTTYDLHNLSYSLIQLSRYNSAGRVLRNLIELDPEDGLAYYNLGVVYLQTGRYASAARVLERAAWLLPSDPDAWYLLAYAAINNDDLTRAWEVLDILIALDEDDALDVFETLVQVERDREVDLSGW